MKISSRKLIKMIVSSSIGIQKQVDSLEWPSQRQKGDEKTMSLKMRTWEKVNPQEEARPNPEEKYQKRDVSSVEVTTMPQNAQKEMAKENQAKGEAKEKEKIRGFPRGHCRITIQVRHRRLGIRGIPSKATGKETSRRATREKEWEISMSTR